MSEHRTETPHLWDRVRECIGKECKIFNSCPFRNKIEHRYRKYVNPQEYRCPPEYRGYTDIMGNRFNVDEHLVDPIAGTPMTYVDRGRVYFRRRGPNQQNTLGPCLVEEHYMQSISQPLVRLMEQANDPFINQLIGYHLVPRYLDLLHLKIERLANARTVMIEGKTGAQKINPIFNELRRASDSILRLWKTSGLEEIARQCGFFHIGGKIMPDEDDFGFDFEAHGDPGAYDRMASGD